MNCYLHHELNAVSQCKVCGRGLCPSCTDKYKTPQCDGCKSGIKSKGKNKVIIELFLTMLAGIIMYNLYIDGFFDKTGSQQLIDARLISPKEDVVLTVLMGAGIVSGWYTISSLSKYNNWIVFGSLIYWIMRYIFKFIASFLIGVWILPFRTLYNIWRLLK